MINVILVIQLLALLICGIFAIGCLFLIGYSYRPSNREKIFQAKTNHAIKMGGIGAFFFLDLLLIFAIVIWMETGNYRSMVAAIPFLCILPFVVAFFGIASYFQVVYLNKLMKVNQNVINHISEKKQKKG